MTLSYIISSVRNYAKSVSLNLLISWIIAFLSDRFQLIRIENVESHISRVTSAVPQGSVFRPILFILFINDLDYVLSDKAYFKLFADDLKIYSTFKILTLKIFNMLLIYLCFGQKTGSFQSIFLKHNCYILVRLLMYILTSLMALLSYLQTSSGSWYHHG